MQEVNTNRHMNENTVRGRPDYLQKLKVPEGYEKINDYSNIWHVAADGIIAKESVVLGCIEAKFCK